MGHMLRREQFFHQRAQSVGLLNDDLRVFAQARFFQLVFQQLRRAAYAAQRILDFMRQIAQQQAIGLGLVKHLLLACQLQGAVDGVKFQQQRIRAGLYRRGRAGQMKLPCM